MLSIYICYAAGRADRGKPIITEAALAKFLAAHGYNEVYRCSASSAATA